MSTVTKPEMGNRIAQLTRTATKCRLRLLGVSKRIWREEIHQAWALCDWQCEWECVHCAHFDVTNFLSLTKPAIGTLSAHVCSLSIHVAAVFWDRKSAGWGWASPVLWKLELGRNWWRVHCKHPEELAWCYEVLSFSVLRAPPYSLPRSISDSNVLSD